MGDRSPPPLFQQCIHYVADNIEIVESFEGFPSQIGKHIFKSCLGKKKFMTENLTALELFASEFGTELLTSLNLSGEYLCLNYYLEHYLLFTDLTELDVSNCGLGDNHEILANFANMHRLNVFNLSDNCISDVGIQRMTTPFRMLKKGPVSLSFLNLTGNSQVSLKCLKYLSNFLNLAVRLHGTLPGKTSELKKWKFRIDKQSEPKKIETDGWAASLIENWILFVKSRQKSVKTRKQTFYTKPVHTQVLAVSSKTSSQGDVIIAQNITGERQNEQVCKMLTEQTKISVNQIDSEDNDLLSMYAPQKHSFTSKVPTTNFKQSGEHGSAIQFRVLDRFDNYTRCIDSRTTNKNPTKSRLVTIQSLRKHTISNSPKQGLLVDDKGKVKKETKPIKHYFLHQFNEPKASSELTDETNENNGIVGVKEAESRAVLDHTRSEPQLPVIKGKDKNEKGSLGKKRKRIVLRKPSPDNPAEDMTHDRVKRPKFNTGIKDRLNEGHTLKMQEDKKTSFLSYLDSYI